MLPNFMRIVHDHNHHVDDDENNHDKIEKNIIINHRSSKKTKFFSLNTTRKLSSSPSSSLSLSLSFLFSSSSWFMSIFFFILLSSSLLSTTITNAETYNEFGDGNLGIAYEFKIHIDAGKEDCYYQYIESGSSLYIAFQVMRGGDSNAGFYVNGPTGQTIMPYQWKQHAELDDSNVLQSGYYTLCIDNKPSSFQSKLVSLYLASLKKDEWDKYVKELSESDITTNNATKHLRNVQFNLQEIMKYLEYSKIQHTNDWYLIQSNYSYVQNWSILQCFVIIICSIVQVLFVRKLFTSNEYYNQKTGGKVRA